MIVAGKYSFNGGEKYINKKYKTLLVEIYQIISMVDANEHKTKKSKEKTMKGKKLFSPKSLNKAFKAGFLGKHWQRVKVKCDYPTNYYTKSYQPKI